VGDAQELRPPIGIDKGSATRTLADGAHAALVAGDDHGDLPAYAALTHVMAGRRLAHALRVAVRSAEAPAELLRQANHEVDGPAGLLALLGVLADLLESS
jgi:trehalose 6-phosphate phosphatase